MGIRGDGRQDAARAGGRVCQGDRSSRPTGPGTKTLSWTLIFQLAWLPHLPRVRSPWLRSIPRLQRDVPDQPLLLRHRSGREKAVRVDLFPAYDEDGGLLASLAPRNE